MAQMWTVIGVMATASAAMIGFSYRAMTEQGKTLMARMNGFCGELNARMDGLRGEVSAQMDGLRGEMNARFDHLTARMERVESIDRHAHQLPIMMMGREAPPRN